MGTSPPGDTYNEDGVGTPLVNGPVEFGDRFPVRKKWTTVANADVPGRGSDLLCPWLNHRQKSDLGRRLLPGARCLHDPLFNDCQPFVTQVIDVGLEQLLCKITGSVFPNLNAPDIKGFQVLHPPEAIFVQYCTIMRRSLMHNVAGTACSPVASLTIRDALLPKLLGGEVQVGSLGKVAIAHE